MSREFNTVQTYKPKRNFFDLSHDRKFSCDMGYLVPIFNQEVLPGDTFSVVNQQLLRFAPLLAPIMHKCEVYTHYFFVPNRLIWDNWDEFITGNNGQAPEPVHPYVNFYQGITIHNGSMADYLGLPTGNYSNQHNISPFALASYNLIWNEYYRDQNLQDELPYELVDGNNTDVFLPFFEKPPQRRAWEHDYFTSALPWTQKGEEVLLTFDTESAIPLSWNNNAPDTWREDSGQAFNGYDTGMNAPDLFMAGSGENAGAFATYTDYPDETKRLNVDNSENLSIDLSGSYLMTVNQLRQAMALQRWLELNARAGSRYIETILAHFGVRSADARLQRPEYLGGGRSNVAFSEVLQMSESNVTPQGTMSGHGINYGESHEFKSYFTEHGMIIGIMSIRPRTAYQQGIPKQFLRDDKFDYYWSLLAHLGEQAIENRELYANHLDPKGTFGYIPRYSEYKYINSSVHGDFRDNLNFWHMGRIFENDPNLNASFIQCNPTDRIFAVTDDNVHSIWVHLYQQVKAVRPIPVFSTPLLNG